MPDYYKLKEWGHKIVKLIEAVIKNPRKIKTAIKVVITHHPDGIVFRIKKIINPPFDLNIQYQLWIEKNYPSVKLLADQRKENKKFKYSPKISLITPTYNTPEKFLRECIGSVINQSYGNWELCIADDASINDKVREIIKEYAKKDKRIKYIFRKKNGHISRASNSALKLATGDFVGILDHDDILWPNALYEVVKMLNKDQKLKFIYSDEDKLEEDGQIHVNPFFKPDWSPDYLRSINYITHFSVFGRQLVKKIGSFREGYEGAQDWDLFLRMTRELVPTQIAHVPTILYSWRKSSRSTASEQHALLAKDYAYKNQQKALDDDLKVRGYEGSVIPTRCFGCWEIKYKVIGNPLVTIIIPTKDNYIYISQCLKSIINKTAYKNYQLLIVDTGSSDKNVWRLFKKIKTLHENTKIVKRDKNFSFAGACNLGAKNAQGSYLLFLNNDTEVLTPTWLEDMLSHAQRQEIGAVGCKLLYRDGKIQHLGGVLGLGVDSNRPNIAGHAYKEIKNDRFFHFDSCSIKNYSFVTAACLLIQKKKFDSINGFDERFEIAFNDIDLCLRLYKEKGFYNLVNPNVELIHKEAISIPKPGEGNRNLKQLENEVKLFLNRWGKIKEHDPFYNRNLTLKKEDFSLAI